MKNRNLFLIFTVFFVLTFSFTSIFAQVKKPKKPVKNVNSQIPNGSLLYKISSKNLKKPSYIYGTIHIICPTDMFSLEKIGSYLNQTDGLVLELDMDDPNVMSKMATALNMPEGKKLQDLLTPEKYAKVDEMFKKTLGVPVEVLKQFTPTGLSLIISTSPKSLGCAKPDSYEGEFIKMATDGKKTIDGLESVEDQITALSKTPLEKQAEGLYQMSLDPEKAFAEFKDLIASYKLQDSDKLYETINKQSEKNPDFKGDLLDPRNKNWIPKIEKYITEKPRFIAVGGAHLGGKTGVLNLLKEKGYTITPIKF
jgi:uncharacterized protein YbaP (TraB family)